MIDKLIQQTSRHSVYVQRYSSYLANTFDPYLKQLEKEVAFIMANAPETTQNIRIINRLINEIRRGQFAIYGNYNDEILFSELESFSGLESKWETKNLSAVIDSPSIDLLTASPDQVWAGVMSDPLVFPDSNGVKLLDPFIKDIEAIEVKRIGDIIRTGFITGKTSQQITQEIIGKNGVTNTITKRNIQTMVRTSTNHVSTVARQKTMNKNKDIVIGYEIVSTLDSRTSDICRHHDQGKVYNAGYIIWADGVREKTNNKPKPAFHPNCRTAIVAILDKRFSIDDSKAKRASVGVSGGKQVNANLSYYDWLKQQGNQGRKGRAFVEDVLGEERAKLFLDGGLSVKSFKKLTIDEHFRPIPLDELKAKELLQLAFDRIG